MTLPSRKVLEVQFEQVRSSRSVKAAPSTWLPPGWRFTSSTVSGRGHGVEHADAPRPVGSEVELYKKAVVAAAKPWVMNREGGPAAPSPSPKGVNAAAVGGRALRHGRRVPSRSSAIRSTWREASVNSAARSLPRRRSKAARMPALSWSRTATMNGNPCLAT